MVSDFQPAFPRLCPLLLSLGSNIAIIRTTVITIKMDYPPCIVYFTARYCQEQFGARKNIFWGLNCKDGLVLTNNSLAPTGPL